ncbi:MAG: hypothetical protein QM537_05355 [Candidatus Symbiobacter sp.]|nr:hypothetical protein [Candidatus Symbiobacter sp.]
MQRHNVKGVERNTQATSKEVPSYILTVIGIILGGVALFCTALYFAITFSINAKFEGRDYAATIAAKATDQKIDAINHRIDGIDQRLDRMESKIDKIGDRLDRLIDRKSR